MKRRSGFLGGNVGVEFVLAFVLLLSAVGAWIWYGEGPAKGPDVAISLQANPQAVTTEPAQSAEAPKAPEARPATAEQTTAAAPAEVLAESPEQPLTPNAVIAPSFDEVRRETDGLTVIAGRAAPGSTVRVFLDGTEVASAQADQRGSFAAITQADADGRGHVLALSAEEGGVEVKSEAEILLTPITPVAAAQDQVAETPQADGLPQPEITASGADAPPVPAPDAPTQDATQRASDTAQDIAGAGEADSEAPQQVAILKSDSDGVELIQTGRAPQVMSNVALDTISYSDAGDVQLSGRAQEGSVEVRVYLDNTAFKILPVDVQGRWRGDLPDVDEGIYTLRVDEVDEQGAVTSRVETPFKRESPLVLANAAAASTGPLKAITVQKGATLWAIARDRYGDGTLYVRVFEANSDSIRDPDLIYPGQVFDLPN